MSAIIALLTVLVVTPLFGRTLRVPEQCVTIQAALDSVQDDDTVLVALGVYAEALLAPPHSFVLRGDVVPDTGDYPRPVIDPSVLDNARSRDCLRLDSAGFAVTVEDFVFRNGPQMYPHDPRTAGGIYGLNSPLTLRRCVFDSCWYGIRTYHACHTVERCRFVDNTQSCITALGGTVHVADCLFIPRGLWAIQAQDSTIVERSVFTCDSCGSFFEGVARSIRQCVFGPAYNRWAGFPPVTAGARGDLDICDNVFTQLRMFGNRAMRVINLTDSPVLLLGNSFSQLAPESPSVIAGAVAYSSEQDTEGVHLLAEDNTFTDLESYCVSVDAQAIALNAGARLLRNHFVDLGGSADCPAVCAHVDSTILRDNIFINTGLAVDTWIWPDTFYVVSPDARWNYWGDSTGPYSAMANPGGQGEPIGDNVLFRPWYPDTSFLLSAKPPSIPHPSSFSLLAYPNPFNGTVRLRFEVPETGIYRLELFNTLGQRVKELWSGPVLERKDISIDGSALGSGSYFIRATDIIYNRPVASIKVVLLK